MKQIDEMIRVAYVNPNMRQALLPEIKHQLHEHLLRHMTPYELVSAAHEIAKKVVNSIGSSRLFVFLSKTSGVFREFIEDRTGGGLDMDAFKSLSPDFAWPVISDVLQSDVAPKVVIGLILAFVTGCIVVSLVSGYALFAGKLSIRQKLKNLFQKFKKPSQIAMEAQKNPSDVTSIADKISQPDGSVRPEAVKESDIHSI